MSILEELSRQVIREKGELPTQQVTLKLGDCFERLKPVTDALGGDGHRGDMGKTELLLQQIWPKSHVKVQASLGC